jgi:hypothetical protein
VHLKAVSVHPFVFIASVASRNVPHLVVLHSLLRLGSLELDVHNNGVAADAAAAKVALAVMTRQLPTSNHQGLSLLG